MLIFTNSVFKLKTVHKWTVSNSMVLYLMFVRNGILRSRNDQIIALPSFKRVDLLMFTKSVFRVPKVEICAVLSSTEVDLLMLRNHVFRQRNDQIWSLPS